ncbi:MAG: porin [Planctomycetota bacterium]|nr:porin [Planctomycetota bacterium]
MLNRALWCWIITATCALCLSTQPVLAMQAMETHWKNGLQFSTPDGENKISIGGRLQVDYGFFSEESGVELEQGGIEMRRARLGASGVIGGNYEFKTEYEFAGAKVVFKDAWIGLKDSGFLGKFRIGHQKEPMGLETLTSSKFISFLERSFTSAFTPSRNTGILSSHLLGEEQLGTFAIGFFKDAGSSANSQEEDQSSVTSRITYLPIFEEAGTTLLHLGVSASTRDTTAGMVSYDSDSLAHLGEDLVSASVVADRVDLFGIEAAWVQGPYSLQGEVVTSTIDDDEEVSAWYLQGSYFITGESRAYKRSSGSFTSIKPMNNYGEDGKGAVELAIRFQEIDLEEMATGENAEALSIGVNWHLNPNARVKFNAISASPDTASDYGNDVICYTLRFGINF